MVLEIISACVCKTVHIGDMTKAAAAILVANFNIPRTGTGTISETDIKRTRSEITSAAKPTPPKVSPKNRERKVTHTGIVQPKDVDSSTPRSVKKLAINEGATNVLAVVNQTVNSAPSQTTNSEPVSVKQAEITEHPISPTTGWQHINQYNYIVLCRLVLPSQLYASNFGHI